jgi:ATP-dependent Lon protease
MKIDYLTEKIEVPEKLPVLPLKDVVIFPYMVYPLLIGRPRSIEALQEAMLSGKLLFLCAQKKSETEEPKPDDLFKVGVVSRILQMMKLPNGTIKVLVEGLCRGKVDKYLKTSGFYLAKIDFFALETFENKIELEAQSRNLHSLFSEYVKLNRRIPDEILYGLENISDHQRLADIISAHILQRIETKQTLLEGESLKKQIEKLTSLLSAEIEVLKIEQKIDGTVRSSLSRSQREYYLQQQLKAIKEELGQGEESLVETEELEKKINSQILPLEAKEKAKEELKKLKKMHPYSAESTVVRNYLDWIVSLPWGKYTKDNSDFEKVRKILNQDHYGLEKPKKRILEHLAVLKLVEKVKGPILCLVGPPGVGKTSLGKSIARALGRNFIRMSLGGIRDEAEIRGHRRTYIGSLPGRIVQSMKKAKSMNPVFLLDEVDKIGMDYRGDPAAALLEVLDPEQNNTFTDNYIEVEFDLSKVLFITTANTLHGIPLPLQDRMEIIRLPGYLEHEKMEIAKNYLLPKLLKEHGLEKTKIEFKPKALLKIIRNYTHEAGVREMERQMAAVLRKIAEIFVENKKKRKFEIDEKEIEKFLGAPTYLEKEVEKEKKIGTALGLAWTEFGGEVLPVEVAVMKGTGKLTLTGKLGTVMQESAQAALSYIRENATRYKLALDFFKNIEIHVHVPEGAVPKDGPSAGVTMVCAILSALNKKPCRNDIAMTGEITLRGNILPIGGLNEKVLAAKREGIKTIILPEKNKKDLEELPKELKLGMNFKLAKKVEEVLASVF